MKMEACHHSHYQCMDRPEHESTSPHELALDNTLTRDDVMLGPVVYVVERSAKKLHLLYLHGYQNHTTPGNLGKGMSQPPIRPPLCYGCIERRYEMLPNLRGTSF